MNSLDCARSISNPIQSVGASFYFVPETLSYGKENLNLDGFRFYVLGRGGVLGDVSANVVRSAFGYFSKPSIDKIWNSAKERCAPATAAAEYAACSYRLGQTKFADLDLVAFNEAAKVVVNAADPAGLTLFAGYADLEVPQNPAEAAMHNAVLLRELRGSVHLAAIAATGLQSGVAHAIKRPNDLELFGYTEPVEIPDGAADLLSKAEAATDTTMAVHLDVLDDAGRQALVAGAEAMHATL